MLYNQIYGANNNDPNIKKSWRSPLKNGVQKKNSKGTFEWKGKRKEEGGVSLATFFSNLKKKCGIKSKPKVSVNQQVFWPMKYKSKKKNTMRERREREKKNKKFNWTRERSKWKQEVWARECGLFLSKLFFFFFFDWNNNNNNTNTHRNYAAIKAHFFFFLQIFFTLRPPFFSC